MRSVYEKVIEDLSEIPVVDVHSHINIMKPQAEDIGDILFYHFLRREVFSVGGDDVFLVSEQRLEERIDYFLKYLPLIRNTATYWCVRRILKDLYGMKEDLNERNWRAVNDRIAETKDDYLWPEELLVKRMKVQRCSCCVSDLSSRQREELRKRSFLFPHLEAFSFGPNYLGGLIDFVKHSDNVLPGDLDQAMERLSRFVVGKLQTGIKSLGSAIDEDLRIIPCEEWKIRRIYQSYLQGKKLSVREKNVLATRFLYQMLDTLRDEGVVQWFLGAAWGYGGRKVKFGYGESYVFVNHNLIPNLLKVFKDFPSVQFSLMYCAESLSQQLTIITRMLPNVSLLGFWWHTLFPTYIERLISERIEALPSSKWILVATDAYNCEWSYGKLTLLKECLARTLSRKIEDRYLKFDEAKYIAQRVLYENARQIYRVDV